MPVAHIDRVDTLSSVEREGVIRQVVRKARVTGLVDVDYTVLYTALTNIGIPLQGDPLPGIGFEQLLLTERAAQIIDEDSGTVDVTLTYNHILDGPHQNFSGPLSGIIYGKVSSSVQQKTTNFYRDHGKGPVIPIVVGHKWPANSTHAVGQKETYQQQSGEVNVMIPQKNYHVEGYTNTNTPWLIEEQMTSAINAEPWMGGGVYEWMCTEVKYELLSNPITGSIEGVSRYLFSFDFQHNTDTWNPTAVFIDDNTGKPPSGLNPGPLPPKGLPWALNMGANALGPPGYAQFQSRLLLKGEFFGFYYLTYYREVDFNEVFGLFFEAP